MSSTPQFSTLERTLEHTISVLSARPPSAENRALLIEARRLRSVIANWRSIPPAPDVRDEMLERVLLLSTTAGTSATPTAIAHPAWSPQRAAVDPPGPAHVHDGLPSLEPDAGPRSEVTVMQRLVVPQAASASFRGGARELELLSTSTVQPGADEDPTGLSGVHTLSPALEPAQTAEGRSEFAAHARTPPPVANLVDNRGTIISSVEIASESPAERRDTYRPVDFTVPKTVIDARPVAAASPINPLLVALADAYSPTADAYRSVRRKLATNENPTVIAVTSAGPGEGKTALTLNLALTVRASTRGRVLVVEANLRSPIIAKMIGFEPPECFITQIQRHLDSPQLPWVVAEPFSRLHVLAIDTGIRHDPILDPVGFATTMHQLKNAGYDFVLIDTPPVLGSGDVNVIADAVDGILLAAVPLKSKRRDMRKAAMQLEPAPILGVVLIQT